MGKKKHNKSQQQGTNRGPTQNKNEANAKKETINKLNSSTGTDSEINSDSSQTLNDIPSMPVTELNNLHLASKEGSTLKGSWIEEKGGASSLNRPPVAEDSKIMSRKTTNKNTNNSSKTESWDKDLADESEKHKLKKETPSEISSQSSRNNSKSMSYQSKAYAGKQSFSKCEDPRPIPSKKQDKHRKSTSNTESWDEELAAQELEKDKLEKERFSSQPDSKTTSNDSYGNNSKFTSDRSKTDNRNKNSRKYEEKRPWTKIYSAGAVDLEPTCSPKKIDKYTKSTSNVESYDKWELNDHEQEIDKVIKERASEISRQSSSKNKISSNSDGWNGPTRAIKQSYNPKGKSLDNENLESKTIRSDPDKEYEEYDYECSEANLRKCEYQRVKEIQGDLFQMGEDYSLAHCVAEDMGMGSGIAVQFRQDFKRIDELLNQRTRQGGVAILEDKGRFIYYLVTKRESSGKPTYQKLFSSLFRMRMHMFANNVTKLAIPRIGCGLDRLEWDNVKYMLEFLFRDTNVNITVCNFQQELESEGPAKYKKSSKVVHKELSLEKIEPYTTIIYFSTERGELTEDTKRLAQKFSFLHGFNNSRKTLGDLITFDKHKEYILYGCIVRKSANSDFDFKALQKCAGEIQKRNRKLDYPYEFIAFQAIEDKHDDLINKKITNILQNSITKVDVYVCYSGNLVKDIPPERSVFRPLQGRDTEIPIR